MIKALYIYNPESNGIMIFIWYIDFHINGNTPKWKLVVNLQVLKTQNVKELQMEQHWHF